MTSVRHQADSHGLPRESHEILQAAFHCSAIRAGRASVYKTFTTSMLADASNVHRDRISSRMIRPPRHDRSVPANEALVQNPFDSVRCTLPNNLRVDALILGLALCNAPVSIAATEILLCIALFLRSLVLRRGQARFYVPDIFRYWLVWAAFEVFAYV